jgi:myo-inositol 2-dehydrogenase / D-chiro-inositol 1-dehydrogenase
MQKIRVAIVGAGFSAETHAEGLQRCPHAEAVAVSSHSRERAEDFARRWNIPTATTRWQDLVAHRDVDVVSVCVPTSLHCEVAVAAATNGKHVICEKPLAVSLEEADRMIAAARDNRVRLFYGENWLFAPAMRRVAEIVKSGAIGRLLYYRGRECSGDTHSGYSRQKKYAGGGTLIHMTVHPLGFLLSLKEGVPPVSVYADMTGGGELNLMHPEYDGEDFTLALVTFADRSRGLIEGDFITKGGLDDSVEIFGSEGTLKVNFSQGSPIRAFTTKGLDYAMEKVETSVGWSFPMPDERRSQGWVEEIDHFMTCVKEDRDPRYGADGAGGRRVLEIVEAGYASVREGRPVKLPRAVP